MNFDFSATIILENSRVLLRPLQANDAENLLPVVDEINTLMQFSITPVYSAETLQQYIVQALEEKSKGIRYPFFIFDKQHGKFAGSTSFAAISNKDKRLEIGWTWLGKDFQKTGLNRNCKFLLMQYAFEQLKFERVELKTDERNQQSRHAIEKIGGQQEGILRSHTVMHDGFRRNTVYYSILKQEWPAIKSTVFQNL